LEPLLIQQSSTNTKVQFVLRYTNIRRFKHQMFDQPFEIKPHNPCDPWEWRPRKYPDTRRGL